MPLLRHLKFVFSYLKRYSDVNNTFLRTLVKVSRQSGSYKKSSDRSPKSKYQQKTARIARIGRKINSSA